MPLDKKPYGHLIRKYGKQYATKSRLHCIWSGMKKRSRGKDKTNNYKYYDRGIRMCREWEDYETFLIWALANGYQSHLCIDRIDNDGNYTPENCRWVTTHQQARNKRNVKIYTLNGFSGCLADWAIHTGIERGTLKERLRSCGWSIEKALTTPVRKGNKSGVKGVYFDKNKNRYIASLKINGVTLTRRSTTIDEAKIAYEQLLERRGANYGT